MYTRDENLNITIYGHSPGVGVAPTVTILIPEVARVIIPYLGVSVFVFIFKQAVCKLFITCYTYCCIKSCIEIHSSNTAQSQFKVNCTPSPESNQQTLDLKLLCFYVPILICCQKSLSVSDLLCPLPSKIRETAGGRKKRPLGRSEAAVSPPGGSAHISAPPSWVTDEKYSTSYSSSPYSGTSGRASCSSEQGAHYTRHVLYQHIHDDRYTFYVKYCRGESANCKSDPQLTQLALCSLPTFDHVIIELRRDETAVHKTDQTFKFTIVRPRDRIDGHGCVTRYYIPLNSALSLTDPRFCHTVLCATHRAMCDVQSAGYAGQNQIDPVGTSFRCHDNQITHCVHSNEGNQPLITCAFVSPFSKYHNTPHVADTPADTENSSGSSSERQRSSDSTSSNASQRSKVSGRKPLGNRNHPYSKPSADRNGDDDEDEGRPRLSKVKIPSQCEASDPELAVAEKKRRAKERTSLPGRLDTTTTSGPITADKPMNVSLMSETSFFKILGLAKSWVVGNSNTTIAEDLNDVSHLLTPIKNEEKLSLLSPLSKGTPKIVLQPPPLEIVHDDADEFMTPSSKEPRKYLDTYFTGYGTPEITPVTRINARNKKHNIKSFLHASSLSPRQLVQGNLRERRKSFSDKTTTSPVKDSREGPTVTQDDHHESNRMRHVSEGDVKPLLLDTPDIGRLRYKRVQIKDEGQHECDGHTFHVSNRLVDGSKLSKAAIETEIKATLRNISPEITPGSSKSSSTEVFWHPSAIKDVCSSDLCLHTPTSTSSALNSLKTLLALINQHTNRITDQYHLFNGLRIVYAYDRTSRIPLKNTNKRENLPFVLLHIGKPRDLSITPLRFNPAVEATEICDVSIGNYSLVTLSPKASKHLHTYFSPEIKRDDKGDEQILIIPFVEHPLVMSTVDSAVIDNSNTNEAEEVKSAGSDEEVEPVEAENEENSVRADENESGHLCHKVEGMDVKLS